MSREQRKVRCAEVGEREYAACESEAAESADALLDAWENEKLEEDAADAEGGEVEAY